MQPTIIFDCDGVLVDSETISLRCTTAALRRCGYDIDEAGVFNRFLGVSTSSMVRTIEEEMGRPVPPGFVDDLRRNILAAFEEELRPIENVGETVLRLELPICVASSSVPLRIRRSLEITGLYHLFAPDIFSATMVYRGKPAPDLFLLAARTMAADPAHCIVIEDSVPGILAGRAAGMTVFGFIGGSHIGGYSDDPARDHRAKLMAAGADLVFDRMERLPELIQAAATGVK
jgi:HAD superfamily hydrolase (TIGR01509 family)